MRKDKGYSKREFKITVNGRQVGKLMTFPEATERAKREMPAGFKGWVIISKVYEGGRSSAVASWKNGIRERAR